MVAAHCGRDMLARPTSLEGAKHFFIHLVVATHAQLAVRSLRCLIAVVNCGFHNHQGLSVGLLQG